MALNEGKQQTPQKVEYSRDKPPRSSNPYGDADDQISDPILRLL